ncbi:MAG: peptide chain release factor-like protein [Acidobacteriota bacterium]|nr:peptide chain release factor-like protein [Acidobacteriota bacterium]
MSEQILDESELKVELLMPEKLDSLSVEERVSLLTTALVRVTHIPTGISAVSEGCDNQIKNKEKAVDLLTELLKKKE